MTAQGAVGVTPKPVQRETDQSEIGSEDLVESDRDGLPDAIFDPKSKIKYEDLDMGALHRIHCNYGHPV